MEVAAEDVLGLAGYGGGVSADRAEVGGFVGVALLGDGGVWGRGVFELGVGGFGGGENAGVDLLAEGLRMSRLGK